LPAARQQALEQHLMLFFSGISRFSADVARTKIENLKQRTPELTAMQQMVDAALEILRSPSAPIAEFGSLLHEAWTLKRRLSDRVSNHHIDGIYESARDAGALGGKVLGAGGGGFLAFFVPPEQQDRVKARLKGLIHVPFRFESAGSRIVLYQPNGL
jgi:D-glycero-alpha-D-manno-heptose-7-phosphate kinase